MFFDSIRILKNMTARSSSHKLAMLFVRLLLMTCCVISSFTANANALNIVFVSSGSRPDLTKMGYLIQAAQRRSHNAIMLADVASANACDQLSKYEHRLQVFCFAGKHRASLPPFFSVALSAFRQLQFTPSVVLTSAVLADADALAKKYGVPLVILAENDAGKELGAPPFAKYTKTHLTFADSFVNTIMAAAREYYVDAKRAFVPDSTSGFFATHHVVTERIPGLDLLESSCPNMHHVGFLRADSDGVADSPKNVLEGQSDCSDKFLYANIRAPNALSVSQVDDLLQKLALDSGMCVLWYNSEKAISGPSQIYAESGPRVKMTNSEFASPSYVLLRHKPLVVLSDSVSEVLHDAVFVESPLVFIDAHGAFCSSIARLGIGLCTHSSSPSKVISATLLFLNSTAVRDKIRAVRRMGFILGGAEKALDVVELATLLGPQNTDFFCDSAVFYSPYGFNSSLVLSSSFILSLFICLVWAMCACVISGPTRRRYLAWL